MMAGKGWNGCGWSPCYIIYTIYGKKVKFVSSIYHYPRPLYISISTLSYILPHLSPFPPRCSHSDCLTCLLVLPVHCLYGTHSMCLCSLCTPVSVCLCLSVYFSCLYAYVCMAVYLCLPVSFFPFCPFLSASSIFTAGASLAWYRPSQ